MVTSHPPTDAARPIRALTNSWAQNESLASIRFFGPRTGRWHLSAPSILAGALLHRYSHLDAVDRRNHGAGCLAR
jgi:hypothetical protein